MSSSSLSSSPGPSSSSSSLVASLTYPFTACLPAHQRPTAEPSSSFPALFGRRHAAYQSRGAGAGRDDFASLLNRSSHGSAGRATGPDTDADSEADAISLLSGIAARSPSASTAARARAVERARQRRREQRARQAGLWGLGDWASGLLACGLFGRPKSERRSQVMGDDRMGGEEDRESALREPLLEDEGPEPEGIQLPDQEAESGEEDARSLAEEALDARIVASQDLQAQDTQQLQVKHTVGQTAEEDVAALQAAEEAALAAEEEQAVLDAQRKAAEKAAREGLLAREATKTPRSLSQAEIEAEAEAAAGGFDVDEYDGPLDDGREEESDRDGYYDVDDDGREQEHSEADGPHYDDEDAQPAVIHHHHYYDYHPSEEHMTDPLSSTAPMSPSTVQDEPDETLQDGPDEEDEADMAGLGLGPRRKSTHSASRSSQGKGRSRDGGSSATDRDRERLRHGTGSHSSSGSGSATGSAALSKRSGEKHYQYAAATPSGLGREVPGWTRGTRGSAGSPSLGSSSNNGARRYQLPRPAVAKADDSAADAAAGGFDDWDVPPSASGGEEDEETGDDDAAQDDVWGSPSSHISPKKMSYRERRYLGGEATSGRSGDDGGAGSSDGGRSSGGRSGAGRSRKERRATAMDNGLEEADGL